MRLRLELRRRESDARLSCLESYYAEPHLLRSIWSVCTNINLTYDLPHSVKLDSNLTNSLTH